jgi:GNAT superfamily N-acetyltransferase
MPGAVTIVPVQGKSALELFIRLPERLNRDDASWVAPLRMERRMALTPAKNPYFRHAEAAFWLAMRDGIPVGRISAQEDRLLPPGPDGTRLGHFGMLAAEDDPEIYAALFEAAEAWLRGRGIRRAAGPFNLSVNEETGLLVDGFGTPPMLMMPHDAPQAGPRVEALGYRKVQDLLAYLVDVTAPPPAASAKLVARGLPDNVVLRPLRRKDLHADIVRLVAIFNDAWAGNWGFVPITPEEVDAMAAALRPLLHERLVWFAELDGEAVAFAVCLPNLNEAIRDLSGRMLPLGWARLLWRLKVSGVKTARVPLMGVRRQHAGGMLGRIIPLFLVEAIRREAAAIGIRQIEMSWVLENNLPMRKLAEAFGGRQYKTYRLYEKALVPEAAAA